MPLKTSHNRTAWKLDNAQKAEILTRIAAGEQKAKLAREFDVENSTITNLTKRYHQDITQVRGVLLEDKQRIATKSLHLLERRIDRAIKEPDRTINLDTVLKTASEMWKQIQVEQGQPTSIQTFNVNELQLKLEAKIEELQSKDTKLLESLYDK